MKSAIFLAVAAGKLAAAHATFQSFVIDGKDQGQHKAVRTPSNGNNPIKDVTSTAMVCNGGSKAADTIEVAAGSKLTMQWHHNDPASQGDGDEPIAASHKGPVMVYVAPAESNGEGDVWVKIYEEGLSGGKWGVDNFIANKGAITVTLPSLEAGDYLIRPEIIALHEASAQGAAQFYNGCGQIKVTGSGSAKLPAGVDMTKAYSATDPGVLCNIYGGAVSCTKSKSAGYDIPGPAVWDGASSGSAPATPASSAAPVSTSAPATSASATPSSPASTSVPAPKPTNVGSGYETAPTPTKEAQPSATSTPSTGGNSGATLPETFTIDQFIAWLKEKTGSANAKRFAAAFADRIHARDFN